MTSDLARHPQLQRLLAKVLNGGTWLGTTAIALGLVIALIELQQAGLTTTGKRLVTIGITLFIFLPIFRVMLMLIFFIRDRDYQFCIITILVLVIIAMGATLGIYTTSGMHHLSFMN